MLKQLIVKRAFVTSVAFSCLLAMVFADTWEDTLTSDFSPGTLSGVSVTNDSVSVEPVSDWWNPSQGWWNPAEGWWDTSWQYRKALTINNAGTATLTEYQIKVENPVYNETGLVGSWHLDGGTTGSIANGTTTGLQDTSGYLNNAIASNTNGSGMQWAVGKFDGSIDFDGTDDYTDAGDPLTASLDFGTNDFTVEAWVKADSLKRGGIVSKFRDGGSWYPGYALILNADGTVVWYVSASGSGTGQYSAGVLTAGIWYHLTLVKRANTAYFYINDGLDNSLSANYNVDNSYSLWIGSTYNSGGNECFDGLIDDVRVYNRALGIDEIKTRYNARAKLNYGDIRFTNSSGVELSYWAEKDGRFWVEADSIPVGFSTVYMYYGNTSAVSSSNGPATFDFFDGFDGTSLDTTAKWTVNAGDHSVANGEIIAGSAGSTYIRSQQTFPVDRIVRANVKVASAGTLDSGYVGFADGTDRPVASVSSNVVMTFAYSSLTAGYFDTAISTTQYTATTMTYLDRSSYHAEEVHRISTTSAKIYQDGILKNTSSTNIPSGSLPVAIGRCDIGVVKYDFVAVRKYASAEPVVFAGSEVSQVSQWQYRKAIAVNNGGAPALSDYQVKVANPVYDETGLVGSWHFDEGVGTSAADLSGCGNIGALTNGPAWTADGRVDNALSFDGTDDYITIPDSPYWNLSSSSWSVAFWIRPADLAGSRVYYGRSADDSLNGGENYLYYQTSAAPAGISWGPINSEWDTGVTLTVSQWQYITMVYDAVTGKAYCYVDGQPRASVAVTSVGSSTGPFKIADNYNGNHFIGLMDEFRVYNRALTANEIAARFSAKSKLNYGDVRFTDDLGIELPFWMEKDGIFWLRMDSVPAGLTSAFMYYGNSSATAVSSGAAVFYLFDDFNDKSFDSSKWDIGTGSSVTETDGVLKVTNNGGTTPTSVSSKTYMAQDAVMEARMKWVSTAGTSHMGFVVRDSVQLLTRGPANNDFYWNDGSQKGTLSYNPPQDTWHFLRATYSGVNGTGYLRNIYSGSEITNSVNNLAVTSSGKCGLLVWTSTTDWFDDVRVRQYAATEPVCTTGSEVVPASQWLNRRQLTVTNNSSSSILPAGYTVGVDMGLASLAATGKAQADADDAVLVYKDPSSGMNYELDRTIDTGKAVVFDGVDDYLTAPDSADWDLTASDGTMAFWVKPTNLASAVFINQVNNDQNWSTYVYATGSVGIGRLGINEIVTPVGAIINNVWQHIAFVKSGGTTYIYVNGVQAGSGGVSWWTNPVNPFKIGGHVYSSTNSYYNGAMDEVAFFKRALNTTEISELYNFGIPKPLPMTSVGADANLVAYYPFDGDYGDHSTKGNNCTVVNGTYFTEGRVMLIPDLKQGAYLDGTNDYISIAHASNLTFDKTNSFSLEAWVKTASAAGYPTIIRKAKSTPNYEGYWLRLYNSTGKLSLQMYGTNGSRLGRYGSTNLADNAWHHVAATYDGSSTEAGIKLYVDGAEQSYTTDSSGTVDSMINTQPLVIGGDSAYWNGIIDDVAVYNRALSAPEISSAYNGGTGTRVSAVSTSGLIGYWELDGSCADRSGNNNNGMVINGAFFTTGKLLTTGANTINFKTLADISASSSNVTDYFVYYGNTGASVPPANVNNVYLLADDFNDGFDNGWVRSVGTWALEGGEYSQSDTASGDTNANHPVVLSTAVQCKLRMRWLAVGASGDFGIHIFDSAQTGGGRGNSYLLWEIRSANQLKIYESINDTLTDRGSMGDTAPAQYLMGNYTITYDPSTGVLDFKHEETGNTLSWTDTTPLTSGSYISLRTNSGHVHYDDLKIYKYIATEPTVSSGTEQFPYCSTGAFTSGIKDAGANDATVDSIYWNTTGAGIITMQLRADNTTAGWTDSSPAWEDVTNGDISVDAIGRYIQYKAVLTGDGTAAEPVLTDVTIVYTIPIIPPDNSVSGNRSANTWYSTPGFVFSNDIGFGADITKYYYIWDNNSSYAFDLSESVWTSGSLALNATTSDPWFIHYLPYSTTGTPGSANDFGPFMYDGMAPSAPALTSPSNNSTNSSTTTSFNWGAVTDASGVTYKLELDKFSAFNAPVMTKLGLAATSYTMTGVGQEALVGITNYFWRVTAVDGAGNSTASATYKFTTSSSVPQVVNPSSGESYSTIQAALDSLNTLDGDIITINDSISHNESIDITKDITVEDGILSPSSGFAVVGQGSSGGEVLRNCVITAGGISNLALGQNLTIYGTVPSNPIILQNSHLVNCLIKNGTVVINCVLDNCFSEATEDMFVNASGGNFRLMDTATGAIDQGMDLSAQFMVDIEGHDRGVNVLDIDNDSSAWDIGAYEYQLTSGYINDPVTEPPPETEVTSPPSLPTLEFPENSAGNLLSTVAFFWGDSSGGAPVTYSLQLSKFEGMSPKTYEANDLTDNYAEVSGLEIDTTYYWRVRASNPYGMSSWTAVRSFTTGSEAFSMISVLPGSLWFYVPNSTTSLKTKTITVIDGGNKDFNWSISSDQEWLTLSPETGDTQSDVAVTVTVDIAGMEVGNYNATISIVSDDGVVNSPFEVPVTLVLYNQDAEGSFGGGSSIGDTEVPSKPVPMTPLNWQDGIYPAPTLTWSVSSGNPTGYWVQVSTTEDFSAIVISKVVSTPSFNTSSLMAGGLYYWRVKAANSQGASAWSDTYIFGIKGSDESDASSVKGCFLKMLMK